MREVSRKSVRSRSVAGKAERGGKSWIGVGGKV